ncbi:hypothetical protein M0R45_037307 [Rubus argutus]|uniref:CASP-like protein n=1 Tax=Rubus argutus TaxID=59490 RepID=A0AAW1W3T8_RUBAR
MATSMLPPTVARIVTLALRVLTAIILFVSFIMLVTNSVETTDYRDSSKAKTSRFYDRTGFQYMAAVTVIGILFSIYGAVAVALRIKRGDDEGNLLFDFYGQKVLSNLLVSAAVGGFLTVQSMEKELFDFYRDESKYQGARNYWSLYKTTSGLVLLAFFFSLVLSILSSHRLARRDD